MMCVVGLEPVVASFWYTIQWFQDLEHIVFPYSQLFFQFLWWSHVEFAVQVGVRLYVCLGYVAKEYVHIGIDFHGGDAQYYALADTLDRGGLGKNQFLSVIIICLHDESGFFECCVCA